MSSTSTTTTNISPVLVTAPIPNEIVTTTGGIGTTTMIGPRRPSATSVNNPLVLNISSHSIRSSLGDVLILLEQEETTLIQNVKLVNKRGHQENDDNDDDDEPSQSHRRRRRGLQINNVEKMFFTKLGQFPLQKLHLNFDDTEQHQQQGVVAPPTTTISCEMLALTIRGCGHSLQGLKLTNATLTGNAKDLGLAIQNHAPMLRGLCMIKISSATTTTTTNSNVFDWHLLLESIITPVNNKKSPSSLSHIAILPSLEDEDFHEDQQGSNRSSTTLLGASLSGLFCSSNKDLLKLSGTVIPGYHPSVIPHLPTILEALQTNQTLTNLHIYLPPPQATSSSSSSTESSSSASSGVGDLLGKALALNKTLTKLTIFSNGGSSPSSSSLLLLSSALLLCTQQLRPVLNALKSYNRTLQSLRFDFTESQWWPQTTTSTTGERQEEQYHRRHNNNNNNNNIMHGNYNNYNHTNSSSQQDDPDHDGTIATTSLYIEDDQELQVQKQRESWLRMMFWSDIRQMVQENTVLTMIDFVGSKSKSQSNKKDSHQNKTNASSSPLSLLLSSPPDEEIQTAVAFYLKLNKLGRRHLPQQQQQQLEEASSTTTKQRQRQRQRHRQDWLEFVMTNHKDVSVVFYALSTNPSMLVDSLLATTGATPTTIALEEPAAAAAAAALAAGSLETPGFVHSETSAFIRCHHSSSSVLVPLSCSSLNTAAKTTLKQKNEQLYDNQSGIINSPTKWEQSTNSSSSSLKDVVQRRRRRRRLRFKLRLPKMMIIFNNKQK